MIDVYPRTRGLYAGAGSQMGPSQESLMTGSTGSMNQADRMRAMQNAFNPLPGPQDVPSSGPKSSLPRF